MQSAQLFGLLGMAGAAVMAISDLLLLAIPAGAGTYYGRDQGRGGMRKISRRRLYAGSALGVLAGGPMQLAGVWLVYLGLRPAGPRYALPVALAFAYTIIIAIAIHATFALMGDSLQAQEQVSKQSKPLLLAQDRRFVRYWQTLLITAAIPLILGSAWFAYALLTQATAWVAWVAIANPALLIAAIFLLTLILPRPLAGCFNPALYNWMWLLHFAVITLTFN